MANYCNKRAVGRQPTLIKSNKRARLQILEGQRGNERARLQLLEGCRLATQTIKGFPARIFSLNFLPRKT